MPLFGWIALCAGCIVVYIVGYVLLRTSGDGRSAGERLLHPGRGGLQEEHGGDGHGLVRRSVGSRRTR